MGDKSPIFLKKEACFFGREFGFSIFTPFQGGHRGKFSIQTFTYWIECLDAEENHL